MGFFRHSSNSRTTDTIPASTTLSARPRFTGRRTVFIVSALACAGVFYMVSVSARSNPTPSSAAASDHNPTHSSAVQFNIDHQSSATAQDPASDTTRASTHITTTLTTSNDSAGATQPSTSLTVNGQPVEVPSNGSTSKTITDENGQTSVQVNTSSDGNASNSNVTSLQVNVSASNDTSSDSSP